MQARRKGTYSRLSVNEINAIGENLQIDISGPTRSCWLKLYAQPLEWFLVLTPRIPDACVNTKFKNYHWGDLTRGKFEAKEAGADAAVHLSMEGFLTEGAGFNLFFARNGRLYTPARNVLQGVTRAAVIDLAAELGIPAEIGDYTADELRAAVNGWVGQPPR